MTTKDETTVTELPVDEAGLEPATTTEIVNRPSQTGVQTMAAALDVMAFVKAEYEAQGDIRSMVLSRVINAETPESVFSMFDDRETEEWLDRPVQIQGFIWNLSDIERDDDPDDEADHYYAICDVVDLKTGEAGIASFGAENCIAQLWAWKNMDAFPINACMVESAKKTKRGFKPRHFRSVGAEEIGPDGF